MDAIQRALESSRSTILFGSLGLQPSMLEFYFNAIPDLISLSPDEPLFLYKGHILFICIEPPFRAILAPHVWQIVFTSHLYLTWNPLYTRVENIHVPLTTKFLEEDDNILDVSNSSCTHEAFLTICKHIHDTSKWALKCPNKIRMMLREELKHMGNSPYILHLKTIL